MPEPNTIPAAIPRTLHDWIRTATFDLCDEAKASVYAEYEAHFVDAVEAEMESGKPRADAEAAALGALGNPNAAQRALTRIHLTPPEARFLSEEIRKSKRPAHEPEKNPFFSLAEFFSRVRKRDKRASLELVNFLLAILAYSLWRGQVLLLLLAAYGVYSLHGQCQGYLKRLWPDRLALRSVLIAGLVLRFSFTIVFFALALPFVSGGDRGSLVIAWITVLLIQSIDLRPRLSLIRKLGRDARIANDFEPPQTLSA